MIGLIVISILILIAWMTLSQQRFMAFLIAMLIILFWSTHKLNERIANVEESINLAGLEYLLKGKE